MTATHLLRDVDPFAITICKKGANRQTIFLRKEGESGEQLLTLPAPHTLLKDAADDWTTFYCVVAEPGAEEDPGQGADSSIVDMWKDDEEIRRAAHRFARNKGYVNRMHGAMAEQGCTVVENAVALTDFEVNGVTIKKGSWYLAIEPNDEMRALVDAGEVTGVSLEGMGMRETVRKASFEGAKKCKSCGGKVAKDHGKCKNCGSTSFAKGDGPKAPIPNKKGKTNWVEQAGGFPDYMKRVIEHILGQHPGWLATPAGVSHAIQMGVGIVQNWARGDDGHGHKVNADTQAKAAAAVAEWNAKRGKARMAKESDMETDEKRGLLHKLAVGLGLVESDGDNVGLTDEEKAALDAAIPGETSTVVNKTPKEEDAVDTKLQERIEAIEKSAADQTSAIASLTGLVEKLVEHSTKKKDEEEPDAKSLKKAIVELAKEQGNVTEALAKIVVAVDALGEGSSNQESNGSQRIEKAEEPWYAGMFD